MKYDEIPVAERARLRRKALYSREILWRGLFLGVVAALIGVTVGLFIAHTADLPEVVACVITGFIFSGLWLVFQEAVVEPRIKRACEQMMRNA